MDTTMTPPAPPAPPAPPNPPPTAPRRLTRSRSDRMVAGVAGGIAHTYGFDPAVVRLAVVIITLLSAGAGAVAYVVAWLVVPETDADEPVFSSAMRGASSRGSRRAGAHDPMGRHSPDRRFVIGVALVATGAFVLAHQAGFDRFSRLFWPLALIGGGAAVLLLRERTEVPADAPGSPGSPGSPGPASPGPGRPWTMPAGEAESSSPGVHSSSTEPGSGTLPLPPAAPWSPSAGGAPPAPPSAYPPSLPWPEPPRRPRERVSVARIRRERSMLGRLTWSALLILAGVAWLVDLTGAVGVDARFVLAIELAIVGLALLVGTWFGRSRGLIAVGLLLTLFAGTFAALDVPLRGDIGEHVVRPATISELDSRYRLAIGHLKLDLDGTTLDGRAHRVVLTDAIGYIEVNVAANARVEVKARSDVGSVDILGRPEVGGTHAHSDIVDDPPGTSGPRIVIDAHVGFGAIKVSRSQRIS